jgi:hypothetical protein
MVLFFAYNLRLMDAVAYTTNTKIDFTDGKGEIFRPRLDLAPFFGVYLTGINRKPLSLTVSPVTSRVFKRGLTFFAASYGDN